VRVCKRGGGGVMTRVVGAGRAPQELFQVRGCAGRACAEDRLGPGRRGQQQLVPGKAGAPAGGGSPAEPALQAGMVSCTL
jgi:hypothetical protein